MLHRPFRDPRSNSRPDFFVTSFRKTRGESRFPGSAASRLAITLMDVGDLNKSRPVKVGPILLNLLGF